MLRRRLTNNSNKKIRCENMMVFFFSPSLCIASRHTCAHLYALLCLFLRMSSTLTGSASVCVCVCVCVLESVSTCIAATLTFYYHY